AGEEREPALERYQGVVLFLLLARVPLALPQDRLDAEEDLAGLRRAALVHGGALDVVVVGPGAGEVRLDREDAVRVPGGERPSLRGGAGLQDGRAVLGRAHHVVVAARHDGHAPVFAAL